MFGDVPGGAIIKVNSGQQVTAQPNGHARVTRNASSASMKTSTSMKTQGKKVSMFGDVPQAEGGGNHKCQFATIFKYFGTPATKITQFCCFWLIEVNLEVLEQAETLVKGEKG